MLCNSTNQEMASIFLLLHNYTLDKLISNLISVFIKCGMWRVFTQWVTFLEHSPAHYSYKVSYFNNSYSACWLILSLIYVSSEWNSVWEIWWWYMLWNLSTMQLAKPYLPFFTANIELLRCFSPTGYVGQLLYGTHWWRLWEFRGYFWQGEMELDWQRILQKK